MKSNINGIGGVLVIVGLYLNWESSLGREQYSSAATSGIKDFFGNILANFINGLLAFPIGDVSFALAHGIGNLHISTLLILLGYVMLLISAIIPK